MNNTATAKVTSKFQATIPLAIRKFLGVNKGDLVSFCVNQDNNVVLNKISTEDFAFMKALEPTLSEWNSNEDDQLFKDL